MTERKSNMELLRIFSMILIITFHYAYKGGFDFGAELSINMLLIKTCWMFGELGVNLFILITGYFMVEGSFKWKKLVLLLAEVFFYHWLTIGIAWRLGLYEFSGLKAVFLTFFPVLLNRYWFITAYIIVYLLSPFLNTFIHAMAQGAYKQFLITTLLLYSVVPTIFGAFYNTTETLLYYNRLIWFVIVYALGAYIRLYGISAILTSKRAAGLSGAAFGVLFFSIVVINKFDGFFTMIGIKEPAYLWPPNTIPMVCFSVGVFGLFLNMRCSYHPVVNRIGSTTLGIYLLHDGVLNRWLWRTVFQNASHQNSPLLFLHVILTVSIIFALGAMIDLARQAIEKRTLQRWLPVEKAIHEIVQDKREKCINHNRGGSNTMAKEKQWSSARKTIGKFAFAVSLAQLSFYQLIDYDSWSIGVTVALSFLCGLFIYKKCEEGNIAYVKDHPQKAVMLFIMAITLVYAMYQVKGIPNKTLLFPPFSLRLFRLRYWLITIPAVFCLLIWLYRGMGKFICKLWKNMDQTDKKIYLWGTIILSLTVIVSYVVEPNWYLQYDKVYSIDSGWVYKNLYPQLSYYDIRHPILSIMTFPIWALVRSMLSLFVPAHLLNGLCVTCVQLVNVQLLILTGAMIKELSKSKWAFLLYMASFPVLTFTMFFEKYQICVFLLVLYVYLLCKNERGKELSLILATGVMPTSILLFGNELLMKEPFAQKVKRIFNTAMCGVVVLICTGRLRLLVPHVLLSETAAKAERFGLKNLPMEECAASFINMVQGAFLSLSSKAEKSYFWTDITHSISFVGGIIFVVVIIGLIWNCKDRFVKLCGIWLLAGVVLFGFFQWGVKESPLFSIYFVWALIPLFQKGTQIVIEKMRWKEKTVYPVVIASMLVINLLTIIDIGKFLKTL